MVFLTQQTDNILLDFTHEELYKFYQQVRLILTLPCHNDLIISFQLELVQTQLDSLS